MEDDHLSGNRGKWITKSRIVYSMNTKDVIKKSLAAGVLIGLGDLANLFSGDRIVGSLLFSLGLLMIAKADLYLFTGKIGFCKLSDVLNPKMWMILGGNFVGIAVTAVIAMLAKPVLLFNSLQEIGSAKFTADIAPIFFLGLLCGVCVQIAVQSKNQCIPILAIMLFVICGFEHCIADFPFLVALPFELSNWVKFLFVVLGNSIGAMSFRFLTTETSA